MYAYEIDDNGYIVENYLINGDVPIPEGSITIQLPQPLPFYRPKWNGEEWVEGATQEEIDELTKVESLPPTEIDLLKEELANTNAMLLDMMELLLGGI